MSNQMLDVNADDCDVQIQIRPDRKVIWVYIGGRTVFRCCRIKDLVISDGGVPIEEAKEGATR